MSKLHVTAAALAVVAVVAAHAEPDAGALTRQQVVAELEQARTAGTLHAFIGEDSGSFHLSRTAATGGAPRAQVLAALRDARADGTLGAMSGEDSGSFHLARTESVGALTRAEVRAAVEAARASGELHAMSGEDSGAFYMTHRAARTEAPSAYAGAAGERDVVAKRAR